MSSCRTVLGDASREHTLSETLLDRARALLVCTDRGDTNVLITLTARNLAPKVRIVSRVEEAENDKLLRQSGANATVLPSRVGGILMADSIESSHLATYVMDLISAGGSVTLMERAPHAEEIGRRPIRESGLDLTGDARPSAMGSGKTTCAFERTTSSS